jgi:hypothetical protein
MKLSRVAVLVSTAVLSVAITGLMVLNYGSADAAEAKKPETPYKFESIGETPQALIQVDKGTMFTQIDDDGDAQVGAVVQLTLKSSPSGPKTLIDAVVAVCGYNGLIVVKGRTYDAQGKLEGETENPLPFPDVNPEAPAGVLYRFLCANAPKATKPDPRYKAPQSYTKFWT